MLVRSPMVTTVLLNVPRHQQDHLGGKRQAALFDHKLIKLSSYQLLSLCILFS